MNQTRTGQVYDLMQPSTSLSPTSFNLAGWVRLVFKARAGRTYLADQYDEPPLKIVRPFELENGRVLVQVMNMTAGVLGGDRFLLEIVVEGGAKVVVVNQSATRVHGMLPGVSAREEVRIEVKSGGEFEYYPGLVIPFADADFSQKITANVAEDSRFGLLQWCAAGRVERGENLAFRRLSTRTGVYLGEKPCYMDALELEPRRCKPAGWGILEGHSYVASGFWHWLDRAECEDYSGPEALLVSGVPAKGQVYLRALARDGLRLQKLVREFLDRQRTAWKLAPVRFERYMGILDQ